MHMTSNAGIVSQKKIGPGFRIHRISEFFQIIQVVRKRLFDQHMYAAAGAELGLLHVKRSWRTNDRRNRSDRVNVIDIRKYLNSSCVDTPQWQVPCPVDMDVG